MVGARYKAVMRSVVDGPLMGLLAPPLSPISGAGCVRPGQSAYTVARNKDPFMLSKP